MVAADFSIFSADSSYGHASGRIEVAAELGPGASIDLSGLAPLPPPPFFSGQIHVESVVSVEGAEDVYACADVCVTSKDEACALGQWLDQVPGLETAFFSIAGPEDLNEVRLPKNGRSR